ncbi:Mediator complex subunit Med16 [Penicillium chermesinum]|uniref:Mediator of RNA polymerase II transcription subunit 16 n=1 Tax=Penicillium chermesinum TaxID=63820 RepID=A0A9W9PHA6_9EURO|nr:Mediator complex subunit Med16 [Penicillium chermesinum]KAJ5246826.1 Mediator complex subunit Med16 [Penicillium chermesinum]
MIMDQGLSVDDLFGESSSLGLGLPTTLRPTKGLAQSLDEMRLSGCCQKIAWSRLGCIAYISPDGLRVSVRHLRSNASDGKWELSEETPLPIVSETHLGNQLVHLSWNEVGSEVAIVDCMGRLSIFSISIALNSITGTRTASVDAGDDSNQIVGLMWLSTQRMVHAFHQAAKALFTQPTRMPWLLCLRAGQIRLIYQNPDNKWAELPAELKNTGYSDRLLTHASMVPTSAGILLATYSVCQKMCLYRVSISWNPQQWDAAAAKKGASFPIPSFHFRHCNIDIPATISTTPRGMEEHSDQQLPFQNLAYSLSRLEVMPGQIDSPTGSTSSPWVLAVFSKPLHATPEYPDQQGPSSVIVRWQLETSPQALHPKFDELSSKKSNAQPKSKIGLRRLDDIYCDKYIISVDAVEHGNALAITFEDSSITFYDIRTMAIFNGLDDPSTVTCLAQAGFHYPMDSPGLSITFSPNACASVFLDSEGQPRLRLMEHTFGSTGEVFDESKFSAAIAALTLTFSRACGADVNTDDILTVALRQLTPEAASTFVGEVYRALPVNCNFTVEQEKLMSHPYIPRCLSLQAALGFQGRVKPRTLSSAVTWATIQLRHAAVLIAFFFQHGKAGQGEALDPEILRVILGNTKWALSFASYLLSEVFDLADEFDGLFTDQEAFTQKLKTTNSLPLIILLSSMSRAFIRFTCRGLRGVQAGFSNINPASLPNEARIYYTEICQVLASSPVRVDIYEKFIAGVDSAVKHAYQGSGFGDNERPAPEKELLVNARIPPVLVTAVATLLKSTVPSIKAEINRKEIVLGDYSWLGFGSDVRTLTFRRTRDVDMLKKAVLRPRASVSGNNAAVQPQKRRRCVRCCEVSGDTTLPRSLPYFRMAAKLNLLRSCPCGGMWMIEPEDATAQSAGHGSHQHQQRQRQSSAVRTPAPVAVA